MDSAIVIVILFLFFGGCIAAVVFVVKKRGWLSAVRGGTVGLLVSVLLFDSRQTRNRFAIPLLAAVVVAWLWPHIVKQRMHENMEESEPDAHDCSESG